jgi:hypothetical protein
MKTRVRSRMVVPVLALASAVLPLTLDFSGDGGVVRLNQACGQATACEAASAYICSQADGDKIGYRCTRGCEPAVQ